MAWHGIYSDPASVTEREALALDVAGRLEASHPDQPVLMAALARELGWSQTATRWVVEALRQRGAWPFLIHPGGSPPPDVPLMSRMHLVGRSRVVRRLALRATRDPRPPRRPTTRARTGPTAAVVATYLTEWKRLRRSQAC